MRGVLLSVALLLVVAACSDTDVARTTVTSATPVTTTAAPAPTTTTTASPSTTAGPTTVPASPATTSTTTTEPPPQLLGLRLEPVASPGRILAMASPGGDPRLFVAERGGVVHAIRSDGTSEDEPFLDISDRVRANGIEQGLLGIVFHPDYAENGRLFVYYTDANDDSVLSEFAGGDGAADPLSERQILFFDQPTERHNAGMLQFGPDGMLYVAVGDGGDGGHHGQKPETLLGTILRIDVDDAEPYAIPADNPFVDGPGAPEVWVYGLRNPWRFWIDDGLIYIADVGQQDWEEVTVLPLDAGGANLGWAYREGSACFNSPECDETETVLPTVEYSHADGCSITGGVVYRGAAIPELDGQYFYSDWCTGWVRSFLYEDGSVVEELEWAELEPGQVNTFGTDGLGEIYIANWAGEVFKLVPVRADG